MLTGSWKTTVIGFVAAVVNYLVSLGPNLPTDGAGWGTVMLSAVLFALGLSSKDANVSNAQSPTPTAQVVK